MRKFLLSVFSLVFAAALLAGAQNNAAKPAAQASTPAADAKPQQPSQPVSSSPFTTQKDKVSYAIGLTVGKGLHRDSIDVDPNVLVQGLKDGLAAGPVQMTDEQIQSTMTELQTQVRERMETKRKQDAETNKKEGD